MAKTIGGKAAKIALAAAGAAALSAVGTGVVQFCKWAKDPYSTELWFGFLKTGILITKTDEPGRYKVQTGYRWHNDASSEELAAEEPVMEIPLPEDLDLPPEETETAADEAEKAAPEEAPEQPKADDEA